MIYQCIYQENLIKWLMGIWIPIIVLFLLFYCKMLGAGDIKVLSVIGGVYGWKYSLMCFFIALLVGSMWSIGKLILYRNGRERFLYIPQYLRTIIYTKRRISYREFSTVDKTATIPFCIAIVLAYGFCLLGGMC